MATSTSTTRVNKFNGLRSGEQSERMSVGDLVEAINVRIDRTGHMLRRSGYRLAQVGVAHSLWAGSSFGYVVIGGVLMELDEALVPRPMVAGLGAERVRYTELLGTGRVYWSNGRRCGVIEQRRNRSWGLEVPQTLQVQRIAGALPAGRYQYTMTLVRADGQESGAARSNVIDLVDGSGVSFVAPTGYDGAVAATLYLSTAGGETMYMAASADAGTTGSYSGNGSDLVSPCLTQFLRPAPPGDELAWFAGRMWVAIGDEIFPSTPFSPELFDLRHNVPMPANVTMLAPQPGNTGMFVGTDKHALYLAGTDPAEMVLTQRHPDPVVAGSLVYVPGALFGEAQLQAAQQGLQVPLWACRSGIYAGLPDGSVMALTLDRHRLTLTGQGASYFDADLRTVVFSAD